MLVLLSLLVVTVQAANECSFSSGQYSLQWMTDNGNVKFKLTYPNFPMNSWTAVGFGESMAAGIDAILIRNDGGRISVGNYYAKGYAPPTRKNVQSLLSSSASISNGILTSEFTRPLQSIDSQSVSLNSGCVTWNFVTVPGTIDNGNLRPHGARPQQKQICNIAQQCGQMNIMRMNGMRQTRQINGVNNTAMYYPMRTVTNQGVLDTNGRQLNNLNNGQNVQRDMGNSNGYVNGNDPNYISTLPSNGGCSFADPYWCDYYVTQNVEYRTKYGGQSKQEVCQLVRTSLSQTANPCCEAMRRYGCM